MQHNENTENLALLYAYNEIEEKDRQAFEQHLKTCAKCQAIIQTCALTTAALPTVYGPAFEVPQRRSLMERITEMFTFRRLLPAGAMILLVSFLAVAAYQYRAQEEADFTDNMFAEITNIEYYIDDIYKDFELL